MSHKQDESGPNSLGLDLQSLSIDDQKDKLPETELKQETKSSSDAGVKEDVPPADQAAGKEKKKPYVNPDRVKTGGAQRDKLTDEELTERMARIREQNERIKQRREDVKKDEDEFKKMQEAERQKAAKTKKVQEHINRTREQNARRKLDKIQNREWDAGKPGGSWKDSKSSTENGEADANRPPAAKIGIRGVVRGGGAGRGRGRGAPPERNTAPAENTETAAGPTSPPAATAES
ncbi:unnamed protein product [Somion occarium]|uniref:Uncharacterized protein n=1 Tax=Somion occarium TaxID=3059160 RepID=A0ABP1D9M8_9APHY